MQNAENLKTLNHLQTAMVGNVAALRRGLAAEADALACRCAEGAEDWRIRQAVGEVTRTRQAIDRFDDKISRMNQLIEADDDASAFRMAVTWALGEMR